jgi:hypothetical protein
MLHARLALLTVAGLLAAACTKPVDVKTVQVTDVTTGWFDAGVVDGKNKLVPSITFRLRSSAGDDLRSVALNIVFRFADNGVDYDEIFKQSVPFHNGQTDLLTVRSQTGYTGEPPQTRADMLKNSNFRDMDAVILVRQAASTWVELFRMRLARQLLTD